MIPTILTYDNNCPFAKRQTYEDKGYYSCGEHGRPPAGVEDEAQPGHVDPLHPHQSQGLAEGCHPPAQVHSGGHLADQCPGDVELGPSGVGAQQEMEHELGAGVEEGGEEAQHADVAPLLVVQDWIRLTRDSLVTEKRNDSWLAVELQQK